MNDSQTIARYFSALMRAALTQEQFGQVIADNAMRADCSSCASHDHIDSNALMYGAFCAHMFRTPEMDSAHDATLINESWRIAKANAFNM